jgi:2-polyprenyl-3-methyl-5-hydroxy-6-metoxy-1,4-benzoquinol methylase
MKEKQSTAEWDEQYRSGAWNYLRSIEQGPRYAIISSWIKFLVNPRGSVLDIGCGEGLLLEWLDEAVTYNGVDWSTVAIERARDSHKGEGQRTFHCASAEEFFPSCQQKFDCIVFNEVLYCCAEPLRLMVNYERLLKSNGYFFLSVTGFEPEFWTNVQRFYGDRFAFCVRVDDPRVGKSWNLAAINVAS